MLISLKDYPNVAKLMRAQGYRKRKVNIMVETLLAPYGTYWEEGSRNFYTLVSLNGETLGTFEFEPTETPIIDIQPRKPVLETGIFMGKPRNAVLWVHPYDEEFFKTGR
jgi:hypothetical protein